MFPLPCGAVSTVPREGFASIVIMPFPDVLWLWHFLYSVGPHPVSSLHIYTFVVSLAFIAGAASQAGDADSSRATGLTSVLQGSVNVHRGALLLVSQWQCISSFVFYIRIVNFLWLSGDAPRLASYGIYISQLVRFSRRCTSVLDFHSKNLQITSITRQKKRKKLQTDVVPDGELKWKGLRQPTGLQKVASFLYARLCIWTVNWNEKD